MRAPRAQWRRRVVRSWCIRYLQPRHPLAQVFIRDTSIVGGKSLSPAGRVFASKGSSTTLKEATLWINSDQRDARKTRVESTYPSRFVFGQLVRSPEG